ncbi:MAG TPA: nicotinate (nicotinamide) nucleotide adenylyltransferase [Muribaculum sp.]|uniref:Probable nicotinate-nucleotide adenylyltransferase n=1 Tax=Heminiphilus faecis TaxID=2601703 RepID=A0ABV4CSG8_9BACT|nr:nicotinate (nicotinamide) nucleotide adenylyltransferase [Heminiphilus faecis]HRF68337.1 nicotinate (nicotinamide) nucleotide adenylyltransferase [Muribaculum sp.]
MKEVIGVLGGSFNPIHSGHLMLASYIAQYGPVDRVWLVLSPRSPFKSDKMLALDSHRFAMLEIACGLSSVIDSCDIELSLPRPSYTITTLRTLATRYPDKSFRLIIGSDNWGGFSGWRDSEAILDEFGLMIYPRPGYELGDIDDPRVIQIKAPVIELSSSFVREGISEGKDMNFFLPSQVYEYIINNKLYINNDGPEIDK